MNAETAKLCHALRLAQEVRATLCTKSTRCNTCGCTYYDDKEEWQRAQALDAVISRLRRLAGK